MPTLRAFPVMLMRGSNVHNMNEPPLWLVKCVGCGAETRLKAWPGQAKRRKRCRECAANPWNRGLKRSTRGGRRVPS